MKQGDKVKIRIPDNEWTAGKNVRQFNGMVATISTTYRNPRYCKYEFTLEECKSPSGSDYYFLEEWLIPLEV